MVFVILTLIVCFFFFQAEDGIRDLVRSRGLGDVYKRQSIFFVSIFETDKGILNIAVECISAFGTVGLSTGITPHLCGASKIVLILTMFVGRINMLTILIAFFKKSSTWVGRYPSESILIN